jgi:hypothetical protein
MDSVLFTVPVQPMKVAYQVPAQNVGSNPPPLVSNADKATSLDQQTVGAASLDQPGSEYSGQEEKHKI